ncbi:MAG: hypothetical protein ACR2QW_09230, partial [bacterium]
MTDSKEHAGTQDPEEPKNSPEHQTATSNQDEASVSQVADPVVQPAPVVAQTSQPGSGKGLAAGAIIMSIVALGAAGYAWYQT